MAKKRWFFAEDLFHGRRAQFAALDEALGQLILAKSAAVGSIAGGDDEVVVAGAGDENPFGQPAVDLDATDRVSAGGSWSVSNIDSWFE